jgi:hypothetical protein
MVLFLSNDRTISTARLWLARAVVLFGALGQAQIVIERGGVFNAPAFAAGVVAGLAALYWVLLYLLSSPADGAAGDSEPAEPDVRRPSEIE